jgi:hypothetical protein
MGVAAIAFAGFSPNEPEPAAQFRLSPRVVSGDRGDRADSPGFPVISLFRPCYFSTNRDFAGFFADFGSRAPPYRDLQGTFAPLRRKPEMEALHSVAEKAILVVANRTDLAESLKSTGVSHA